jgi:hypothetical protein
MDIAGRIQLSCRERTTVENTPKAHKRAVVTICYVCASVARCVAFVTEESISVSDSIHKPNSFVIRLGRPVTAVEVTVSGADVSASRA